MVNINQIPIGMVASIEILPFGASAIYGSDAVAGVINIILKKNMEKTHVKFQIGDTHNGGGESQRLEISSGYQSNRFNLIGSVSYNNNEMMMASQRDYMNSYNDAPNMKNDLTKSSDENIFSIYDPFDADGDGDKYIDPGKNRCESLNSHEKNVNIRHSRTRSNGAFCGSHNLVAQSSILNKQKRISTYLSGTYQLSHSQTLFFRSLLTQNKVLFNPGNTSWTSPFFLNDSVLTSDKFPMIENRSRAFLPSEMGNNRSYLLDNSYNNMLGIKGEAFFGFDYEFSFNLSQNNLTQKKRYIHTKSAQNFFLGQVLSKETINGENLYHHTPQSYDQFYTPLTPKEYQSISGIDLTRAHSQNITTSLTLTNNSFAELPAGDIGLAILLENSHQKYKITPSKQLLNNEWHKRTGTAGGGKRHRSAIGLETRIPILDSLTGTFATRWDQYNDISDIDQAFTYNLGLEYRPFKNLLIRSTQSTAFRAPDMHYIYMQSSSKYTRVTDYYLCRKYNQKNKGSEINCSADNHPANYSIKLDRHSSPQLKEEKGTSSTFGFVWDISENLDISIDYYKNILKNAVTDQYPNYLLQDEADCRLGKTVNNRIIDSRSKQCINTIALIKRKVGSNKINQLQIIPINNSYHIIEGYDMKLHYKWDSGTFGIFKLAIDYNILTKDKEKLYQIDSLYDRRAYYQGIVRSSINTTFNWKYADWNASLFAKRRGSIMNHITTKRCCVKTKYNLALNYNIYDDLKLSLGINDLLNKNPQQDKSNNTYPYYNQAFFSPIGRSYRLGLEMTF
jgi:outer membrane receptor protein involved in Fe transport